MKRALEMVVAGSIILAGTALWALGSHIVWSVQKVLVAAIALAMVGLAVGLSQRQEEQ
jgi:hypothetical protein